MGTPKHTSATKYATLSAAGKAKYDADYATQKATVGHGLTAEHEMLNGKYDKY